MSKKKWKTDVLDNYYLQQGEFSAYLYSIKLGWCLTIQNANGTPLYAKTSFPDGVLGFMEAQQEAETKLDYLSGSTRKEV